MIEGNLVGAPGAEIPSGGAGGEGSEVKEYRTIKADAGGGPVMFLEEDMLGTSDWSLFHEWLREQLFEHHCSVTLEEGRYMTLKEYESLPEFESGDD